MERKRCGLGKKATIYKDRELAEMSKDQNRKGKRDNTVRQCTSKKGGREEYGSLSDDNIGWRGGKHALPDLGSS